MDVAKHAEMIYAAVQSIEDNAQQAHNCLNADAPDGWDQAERVLYATQAQAYATLALVASMELARLDRWNVPL